MSLGNVYEDLRPGSKASRKVYLAGKIRGSSWRDELVEWYDFDTNASLGDEGDWPERGLRGYPGVVCVGPYFIAAECGHSAHCGCDEQRSQVIIAKCLRAIDRCDLVFAWMDRSDSPGSLIEIGYAVGKAKKVIIGFESCLDGSIESWPDQWFLQQLPVFGQLGGSDARSVFDIAIRKLMRWADTQAFGSPLEESFWHEWQQSYPGIRLEPQHRVFGGKYRLDFAHLATKIAVELDGITYHGDKEAFQRDRERDRALSFEGWTVLRFTGDEVRENVTKCASVVQTHVLSRLRVPR